jgi:hypothetical protein
MDKKTYHRPQLTNHGNVETITLQGSQINADVPRGGANTAFPSV